MSNPLLAFCVIYGYQGEDWILPEYNPYYWLGYGQLQRN